MSAERKKLRVDPIKPKTIVYSCPYVPPEWIAAHGFQPRRLIPLPLEGASTIPRIEGLCPYARAFGNDAAACGDMAGIVLTTMCDQMRRLFDLLVRRVDVPVFLLNVPSTWQTPAAQRLYQEELKRLGRFLVRLGGHRLEGQELENTMSQYEVMWELSEVFPERSSCQTLSESVVAPSMLGHRTTRPRSDSRSVPGVPIGVIGGPLMQRDRVLFDVIRDCGACIDFDGTETGGRGKCHLDLWYVRKDYWRELMEAYFRIPDPARRPNSEFYQWLRQELKGSAVRGLVLHHYVWCDKWHAEFARMKEWIQLPMLRLDSEGEGELDSPRVRNRISAFVETLR